jgi:hypothetical protein
MAEGETTSGRRVALTTVIAGILGTLLGTVVGGLISLAAAEENIRAQEESDLRDSRHEAYSDFAADLNGFSQTVLLDLDNDGQIDAAEQLDIDRLSGELNRSIMPAILVASPTASEALTQVNDAYLAWSEALDKDDIRQRAAAEDAFDAFDAFVSAASEDLGVK